MPILKESIVNLHNKLIKTIEEALKDRMSEQYSLEQYNAFTQKLNYFGFKHILLKLNNQAKYSYIIKANKFISVQDAGFGYFCQKNLNLFRNVNKNAMSLFLGGLHNLLIGFVDKIMDLKTTNVKEFVSSVDFKKLKVIGEGDIELLRKEINAIKPSSAEKILAKGIYSYLYDCWKLFNGSNSATGSWERFIDYYLNMYYNEFKSTKLDIGIRDVINNIEEYITIAEGRTKFTLIPHAYFMLWSETKESSLKIEQRIVEALINIGRAMVISEDLSDLIEDTLNNKWNFVSLLYVKENKIEHWESIKVIEEMINSNVISRTVELMIKSINVALDSLEKIGDIHYVKKIVHHVPFYPLLNANNKLNSYSTLTGL